MTGRDYNRRRFLSAVLFLLVSGWPLMAQSQDKIKIAYSSTDTLNQIWTIPQEIGLYKKNGLDVELVYIGTPPSAFRRSSPRTFQSVTRREAVSPTPTCAARTPSVSAARSMPWPMSWWFGTASKLPKT